MTKKELKELYLIARKLHSKAKKLKCRKYHFAHKLIFNFIMKYRSTLEQK